MQQVFKISSDTVRRNICSAVMKADMGMMVEIKTETRSQSQNRKLWPMLQDVSKQVMWPVLKNGNEQLQFLEKSDWKNIFTASLRGYERTHGIDGGLVALGKETSKMNKAEFADLIELIYAFGVDRGVVWSEKALSVYEEYQRGCA